MEGDNYMFNVGDKIVYPMHGAGTIDAIEEKDILGEKQNTQQAMTLKQQKTV